MADLVKTPLERSDSAISNESDSDQSLNKIELADLLKRADKLRENINREHDNLLSSICNVDLHISDNALYIKLIVNHIVLFAWAIEEAQANDVAIQIYNMQFDSKLALFRALYNSETIHKYEPLKTIIMINNLPAAMYKIYQNNLANFSTAFPSKFSMYSYIFDKIYRHKAAYTEIIYEYGSYLFMQEKINMNTKLIFE